MQCHYVHVDMRLGGLYDVTVLNCLAGACITLCRRIKMFLMLYYSVLLYIFLYVYFKVQYKLTGNGKNVA